MLTVRAGAWSGDQTHSYSYLSESTPRAVWPRFDGPVIRRYTVDGRDECIMPSKYAQNGSYTALHGVAEWVQHSLKDLL